MIIKRKEKQIFLPIMKIAFHMKKAQIRALKIIKEQVKIKVRWTNLDRDRMLVYGQRILVKKWRKNKENHLIKVKEVNKASKVNKT